VVRSLVVALALVGCDPVVFQHSLGQCAGESDGTPCDDGNICTTTTVCRAGACGAQNPLDTCKVADSADDFSGTQGEAGFYYGYWKAGADPDGSYASAADFAPMEYCPDEEVSPPGRWMPPGRCALDRGIPGYRWTMNLKFTQHPENRPELELPVRRWVSHVSGPARIEIEHMVRGTGGDGTRALLLVDGVEVWRRETPGSETSPVRAEIDVDLRVGTAIEQLVHPLEEPNNDETHFRIGIHSRNPGADAGNP
jgi:hypothetical protein